jgi:hypothetical protein
MAVILQVDGLRCLYDGMAGRGQVITADQYMKDMVKAHAFMSGINNVLAVGAPGPVKLPFR